MWFTKKRIKKALEKEFLVLTKLKNFSLVALGRTQHKSGWEDVMNKAKRLIADGQVYPEEKRLHDLEDPGGPVYIEGTVVGDHSTYKSQIWTTNSDPRSLAVRSWACQCTWNRYVWNRTRQWRKYEGRICSHVLALYWQAGSIKLDEESQSAIDEYKGKDIPGQDRLVEVEQQTIIPGPRDTERAAPGVVFDYADVPLNPSTNMTLPGMEDFPIIPPDENREDQIRDREQPAEEALRPLDLDEQHSLQDRENQVRLERLRQIDRRKEKASNVTYLFTSSNEEIKDLAKYIQISLLEDRPVFAQTIKDFWGERKNGLHPHPDAKPVDHMEDGNFIYLPHELGWDPEGFQMGSDKEERGTYGSIPEGARVQIISVRSKDKLVLASYDIGNEFPNHNKIEVWIPIKDIYLI
jgi:hypothetical protein